MVDLGVRKQGMESCAMSVNHHLMQHAATLAREVLEWAKKWKVVWPGPVGLQRRALQEGKLNL